MREFFKDKIMNLYVYIGNRQGDKMSDDEIKSLLDILCKVSANYTYIPQDEQKRIIENCMITDKEYQNLNARTVSKWLELNGKKYFSEEAHKPIEEADYLTGEERDKWLDIWRGELNKVQTNFTEGQYKGGGTRLRESMGLPELPKEDKPLKTD